MNETSSAGSKAMSTASLWAGQDLAPGEPLYGNAIADVCIVGLGGAGLEAARILATKGADVIGVDAGAIGGAAAGRNGGFLLAGLPLFHHDAVALVGRERAVASYRETLNEMEHQVAEFPNIVHQTGSLRIASSLEEIADCERQYQAMRTDGLPVESYAGTEGIGLLFPGDGVFNPLERCRAMAQAAREGGARLFEGTPVNLQGNRVITKTGQIKARAVLVAVDGGLEEVLPELNNWVRTTRLQMLATEPANDVAIFRPVYTRGGYDYWQQLPDGRIALGGGRDVGGELEWEATDEASLQVQEYLDHVLRRHIGTRAEVTHRWAARVGYTPDGYPVVKEVRPDVWATGGYNGTGNLWSVINGRKLANRILARLAR